MLRNASAMTAEREALRMGIEHLTVLFLTEDSSFDFQVENSGRTAQYKLTAQSLRLCGLRCGVDDAHCAGANRLQNKKQKRARIGAGKSAKNKSLTENLSNAANNIQGQKAELLLIPTSSSFSSEKNEKEAIEENYTFVSEALQQIVGSDWGEVDETQMKSSIAKAVQDRFKLY